MGHPIPIGDLLRRHPLPVLLALGISIISNSSFYLLLYISTLAAKQLRLPGYTGAQRLGFRRADVQPDNLTSAIGISDHCD